MALGVNIWSPPTAEAAHDYYQFSVENPVEKILDLYASEENGGVLNSDNKAKEITGRIVEAIQNRASFSMIRMGDGEGNCLFDFDQYPTLKSYILDRISYMHFGEGSIVPAHDEEFLRMMIQAIDSSDVIGVPERDAVAKGFKTVDDDLDVRAVVGNRTAALKVAARVGLQTTASAWTNRQLLPHYEEILTGRDAVGVISSHPKLGDLMKKRFGIGKVVEHLIPRQAVFLKTSDRKDSGHFPDVFRDIVDSISPTPGMPYLVSGGLLAKHYCHVIKSRGGVAIDAGSVPEIWLNIPNRGLSQDFLDRWKLV
ncbi:hypothetical protein MUG94_11275 [Arthrobacter gengyunqii]|uniref:GT-D fold-like domain-containing protein n=1 Tax=Arthrobacter gengyunqii TaxID=2886940 RepID=A0A9X1M2S3_9MICC|nr:hypothetical protein [Arthrobacter gengyunqii]MCC3269926.1 hypothetical protein [Arthrobacter gengyunqii]UOY95143.1 hypothetical protein MUG94_11275 [Arthrobacter gengyunqii]